MSNTTAQLHRNLVKALNRKFMGKGTDAELRAARSAYRAHMMTLEA